MIEAYQGETVKIETAVLDTTGQSADLTGVVAKFALLKPNNQRIIKDCEISENILKVTLSPEDTMQIGKYRYEFRIKLNNEVDSLLVDILDIKQAIITSMESEA